MNIYTTEFFAKCPNNGIRIKYQLRIEAEGVIPVEEILAAVDRFREGFHESLADALSTLGGRQTLTADHHGVTIETVRNK